MRFMIAGQRFDLSQDLIRLRLVGHSPESLREHWVDIDGTRWPVKQVVGLATGVERSRFQSHAGLLL